jgi:hypothetical protein
MVLIISGHQRSGTTLLRRLCDAHPQMRIANEFGCFADVGLTVGQAVAARLAQWRLVNGRWAFDSRFASHPRRHWHNLSFGLGYGWQLARVSRGKVTVTAVAHALQKQLGETAVVGDKLPQYTPLLPTLLAQEAVKVLLIYRDGRDVTSSFLENVRTVWQTRSWASELNTAEKIAHHWVAQMNQMAELKATCLPSQLHIMQYEQLVAEPDAALAALAAWLGVAPGGFPLQQVKTSSIGKYRQGLSPAEIAQVEAVAGPTLRQLGYAI